MGESRSNDGKILAITSVLRVTDINAACIYYHDVLGFEIAWLWGEPTSFACVRRDDSEVFFKLCQTTNPAGGGAGLYIFVEDVDAAYEELQGRGADILTPPTVCAYGMKDFDVRDLSGTVLTFGAEDSAE